MKNRFLMYVPVVLSCFVQFSLAQNARVEAMGGIGAIDDISHVLYHPAGINDFPDQVSGTLGSYSDTAGERIEYFGPFIAIKSLGDYFNVGVIANTIEESGSSILYGGFYSTARSFLLEESDEDLPESFPMIPHLLLGFQPAESFSIGIEAFSEIAQFRKKIDTDTIYYTTKKGIYHLGGRASALIAFGPLWLCPIATFGIPYVKGEVTDTATISYSSEEALLLSVGAELGVEVSEANLVAGFFYEKENYTFKKDTIVTPQFESSSISAYLSFSTTFANDIFLAAEYDFSIWSNSEIDTNTTDGIDFKDSYMENTIHVGAEKRIAMDRVLDAVIPRAGVAYTISNYKEEYTNSGGTNYTIIRDYPIDAQDVEISAGFGVRRGLFGLDLYVNIGNWNGTFTGPEAAAVTLSIGEE